MLDDTDMLAIQLDFGTLAAKVACNILRGTDDPVNQSQIAPYTLVTAHMCTVLLITAIPQPYVAAYFAQSGIQTRNARVVLVPLPIPGGKTVKRGDYIVASGMAYHVEDLANEQTYRYQLVTYCQYVEGFAP